LRDAVAHHLVQYAIRRDARPPRPALNLIGYYRNARASFNWEMT
jgi:hypothetical protein